MKVSEFNYILEDEFIAKFPPESRGDSSLMVVHRDTKLIEHKKYSDIVEYIDNNSLVVLNNTKVTKRKIFLKRRTGFQSAFLIIEILPNNEVKALCNRTRKLVLGESLVVGNSEGVFKVIEIKYEIITLKLMSGNLNQLLEKYGIIPLPKYIKREANEDDSLRYNTVFSKETGSVASPTATLNLTESMISQLAEKKVSVEMVNLEIGWGTFSPMHTEDILDHKIHKEKYCMSEEVYRKILSSQKNVWAFGTTAARVLETIYQNKGTMFEGETEIFIYPGYQWGYVNHLLTNFHAPNTTLLCMVASFMGLDLMKECYDQAKKHKYKFLSYGDSMLII